MYEIGSEFNYIDKEKYSADDITRMYDGFGDVSFLRCGRDAIGFVCEDIKLEDIELLNESNTSNGSSSSNGSNSLNTVAASIASDVSYNYVALLPALCCDSMYRPFEVHGMKVLFYGINEDLSVNRQSLKKLIDDVYKNGDDNLKVIVLTAVYYGITDIKELDAYIKSIDSRIIVIEDVTQGVLAPTEFDKESADYVIGSIRKWMGIPDGAVAIKNCNNVSLIQNDQDAKENDQSIHGDDQGTNDFGKKVSFRLKPVLGENSFATERSKALRMKTQYLENGDQDLKAKFRALLGHAEDTLTDGSDIYEMSDESREYLKSIPVKNMVSTRNNNYDTLYELLDKSVYNNRYFKLFPHRMAQNPAFMLPVLMDTDKISKDLKTAGSIDRDGFERILASKGIYAPVLWPVCDEAAIADPMSKEIADHILCFWIDQRYDRFDMVHSAECFEAVLRELVG